MNQRAFHLNPENLLAYEGMTQPSAASALADPVAMRNPVSLISTAILQYWPPRGELLGVSASLAGDMVGFAIAEVYQGVENEPLAELISLKVLAEHADQSIDATLVGHLQKLVGRSIAR